MKIFCFIFARSGSKRIKNKNLQKINGKSLLTHSINFAKKLKIIDKIFVSTDSKKISKVATKYGAIKLDRPTNLSRDASPEWKIWQYAIRQAENQYGAFDAFLTLPTTGPLRSLKDVISAIKKLKKNTDIVITVSKSYRNPYFNVIEKKSNGKYNLVKKTNKKYFEYKKESPTTYDMNTVAYVAKPSYIKRNKNIFAGKVAIQIIPEERALDIDTKFHLRVARFLYKNS